MKIILEFDTLIEVNNWLHIYNFNQLLLDNDVGIYVNNYRTTLASVRFDNNKFKWIIKTATISRNGPSEVC